MEELKEYWDNEGELCRDLERLDDGTQMEDIKRYEIIFEVKNIRYYCFVDAITMNEALGIFFVSHPNISYHMIHEHLEI